MKLKLLVLALAFACACLSCSTDVWAQAGTGELTGLVTDSTGAVVPGVQVNLVNSATGAARQTQTSSAGVYRFVSLPIVGTYTLTVEQTGFKVAKVEGLVISVGTTVTRDIKLEVGAPAEVVTVTSGAEVVQSTESSVSTLIDRNVWQNMPLEIRSQNSFIELVAGAVPDAMAGSTRGAAVNGARGGTGNYLVEGLDNNDQGQGGRGQLSNGPGGAATSISPDAIGEYRVITNSFAAEYGKAGGFVTDTVLKSGTNQFHGSLFEYYRGQALAANDFFSNANGIQDSLVRNQFGGSIGGPIIKDKAFFFYAMEWQRMRQAGSLSGTSTTQQYLDFVKSGGLQQWAESDPDGICMQNLGAACPGAFSQSGTYGPIFSNLLSTQNFPLATTDLSNEGQGWYTYGLTYPVPVYGTTYVSDPYHLNDYRITAKIDYTLGSKDLLSGIYLNQTANSGDPFQGGQALIGPAYLNDGRGQNWGVTWSHIFGPTITNTAKAGYLRHRSDFPQAPGTAGIPAIATGVDPLEVGFGMYAGLPQFFTETQYQFQNHMSIIHGKHSFKFGGEYRRTVNASSFYNDTYGTFYPWGIEDLATDLAFTDEADLAVLGDLENGSVYYTSAAVNPATGGLPEVYRGFRASEFAAYIQDDWRVSQRLTLNLGLRYEYFGVPHNYEPDIDSNFYFGTPVTPVPTTSTNPFFPLNNSFYAQVATGTFQVRNHEIWNKDTNNFGPRVGFAYDLLGNQSLILRGGAGVMYDRLFNNVFENIRFNPPYFSDNQIGLYGNGVPAGALSTPGLYTVPFSSRPAYASGYSAKPNPRHMDQNLVTAYYEQFHLGIEWEFIKGWALEVEYIGTLGHKLTGYYDINTFNGRVASGLSNTRINNNIGADNYRNNNFSSNYHAGQATVRKNFTGGLGLNASYTWSRALDYLSDVFNNRGSSVVTDTMNPRVDYGPADFNMTNRFVTTVSYELPWAKESRWIGGWQFNAIVALQSGVPFSPYASSSNDVNKNGVLNDRVVYTGSGGPMDSVQSGTSPADGYLDKTQWARYVCPDSVNGGLWCSSPQGRGSMIGPAYQNVDFNVIKRFRIKESSYVSLQAGFFNLFNHTNFANPTFNLSSSSFGKSTSDYGARVIQLAARIDF
jgi:outer membrane receptor protein involved in Fe transport